jgi:hypothetical protein
MSVQANDGAYCTPREDFPDTPYTHVECGYPNQDPVTKELLECAEDSSRYTDTVYGWVPIEVVQSEIDAHGGIYKGELPSNVEGFDFANWK